MKLLIILVSLAIVVMVVLDIARVMKTGSNNISFKRIGCYATLALIIPIMLASLIGDNAFLLFLLLLSDALCIYFWAGRKKAERVRKEKEATKEATKPLVVSKDGKVVETKQTGPVSTEVKSQFIGGSPVSMENIKTGDAIKPSIYNKIGTLADLTDAIDEKGRAIKRSIIETKDKICHATVDFFCEDNEDRQKELMANFTSNNDFTIAHKIDSAVVLAMQYGLNPENTKVVIHLKTSKILEITVAILKHTKEAIKETAMYIIENCQSSEAAVFLQKPNGDQILLDNLETMDYLISNPKIIDVLSNPKAALERLSGTNAYETKSAFGMFNSVLYTDSADKMALIKHSDAFGVRDALVLSAPKFALDSSAIQGDWTTYISLVPKCDDLFKDGVSVEYTKANDLTTHIKDMIDQFEICGIEKSSIVFFLYCHTPESKDKSLCVSFTAEQITDANTVQFVSMMLSIGIKIGGGEYIIRSTYNIGGKTSNGKYKGLTRLPCMDFDAGRMEVLYDVSTRKDNKFYFDNVPGIAFYVEDDVLTPDVFVDTHVLKGAFKIEKAKAVTTMRTAVGEPLNPSNRLYNETLNVVKVTNNRIMRVGIQFESVEAIEALIDKGLAIPELLVKLLSYMWITEYDAMLFTDTVGLFPRYRKTEVSNDIKPVQTHYFGAE